jgi:hypothetical protein
MADIITEGFIPSDAYPLKLIHSGDNGYLILLLDEEDDNSTIVVHSIDFEDVTDPGLDPFQSYVVPRADIDKNLLMPYRTLSLEAVMYQEAK